MPQHLKFTLGPATATVTIFAPGEDEAVPDGDWVLSSIRVPADARMLGHGSKLLEHIKGEARRAGVPGIFLDVFQTDDGLDPAGLHQWYDRHGFTPAGSESRRWSSNV